MAYTGPEPITWSFVAGADLSAQQYHFVKLNTSGQIVAVAAATDTPIGLLLDKPTSGQTGEVLILGLGKVKAGGTITPSTHPQIGTDSSGQAVALALVADTSTTNTTKFGLGVPITAAASGELVTAFINCTVVNRNG